MITSLQNTRLKWVRALQAQSSLRRQEGVFIVEGVRLAEEAFQAGWAARLVFYTEDLAERGRMVVEGFAAHGAAVEAVSQAVMGHASDTQTPQGILAVVDYRLLAIPERLDFVFIAAGVRDPGNLGTMLRTAAAAGVQAVLLPPAGVDAFSPKVVRAGMGAHFRLPVHSLSWEEIHLRLKEMQVYLAAAKAGLSCFEADFRSPLALIVGGEAEGAGPEAERLASSFVHIPMPGGSESLNAAIAAGVLLFEVARQRQSSDKD